MQQQIQKLIKLSRQPELTREAFEFAKQSYQDKKRSSGEDYIDHATNVAFLLSQMGLDQTTVIAGLLHDTADTQDPKQKQLILETIEKKFGKEVADIVDKSSQLNKIYYVTRAGLLQDKLLSKVNTENLKNMVFAISQDVRVILIDLASRIDGLEKINRIPEARQKAYLAETMEIFAPVANRLGLGEIKRKLEDLSFEKLYPESFTWLSEHIQEQFQARQDYLKACIPHIKKILKKEKVNFLEINYRAKSSWSTYQKLLTHNMDFEKIHDLVALKIIVKDVATCYKALGVIHKYYPPLPGEIKDYIAKPKINGYQSLHTSVLLEQGKISEIQIKTEKMQEESEYGICAHWAYKEKLDLKKQEHFTWNSKIPEMLKNFRIDFYQDNIFAFTPKGDVIMLPKGATPIDFAYALHSEIGDHCESAKIDGKIIQLSQTLNNGDIVEIITNKKKIPSYDWLKFVKTNFAKSRIKKLISNIPVSLFSVPNFVKRKISEISEKSQKIKQEKGKIKKEQPRQIYLAGQKGMMVTIAKCCMPEPGDQAKAYLTKSHVTMLHKISCPNLQKLSQKFPEKVLDATWK